MRSSASALKAFSATLARSRFWVGVVDQHMKLCIALFELAGHAAYLGKFGEVRFEEISHENQ